MVQIRTAVHKTLGGLLRGLATAARGPFRRRRRPTKGHTTLGPQIDHQAWNGVPLEAGPPPWPVFPGDSLPGWRGPFETMRVNGGRAIALERHLHRIRTTTGRIGWAFPDLGGLPDLIAAFAPSRGEVRARLTVTTIEAPSPTVGWALQVGPMPPSLVERRRGVHVVTRRAPRSPEGADSKTVERARVLARLGAECNGREPLLVGEDGDLLEGATWNLFAVLDGVVTTPPAEGSILPGVTRARVLEVARRVGLRIAESPLRGDHVLRDASEVFVSNALLPLAPLCSLDAHILPGAGPVLDRLRKEIDALTP
jgi:branched-subunit amino acid aminotransferase/4-amino-4-deoxychorismate lyase